MRQRNYFFVNRAKKFMFKWRQIVFLLLLLLFQTKLVCKWTAKKHFSFLWPKSILISCSPFLTSSAGLSLTARYSIHYITTYERMKRWCFYFIIFFTWNHYKNNEKVIQEMIVQVFYCWNFRTSMNYCLLLLLLVVDRYHFTNHRIVFKNIVCKRLYVIS